MGDTTPELPFDNELERLVLYAMLYTPESREDIFATLPDPDAFHGLSNKRHYEAMLRLRERGEDINPCTVVNECCTRGSDRSTEYVMISAITDSGAASLNWRTNARILAELSTKRDLIRAADRIRSDIIYSDGDIVSLAEGVVSATRRTRTDEKVKPVSSLMSDILSADASKDVDGVRVGFGDLDRITGGFKPGWLVIIAARPSIGKSALASNFAVNAAKTGAAVLFFSLEMSSEQIAKRMLSTESGVEHYKIDRQEWSDAEGTLVVKAAGALASSCTHLALCDSPMSSVATMRELARKQLSIHDGDRMVIVDYLQLINTTQRDNRQVEVSEISRGLKLMARELECPVIALSQLSRAVENRAGKRPMLSDLRESGAIEQDADLVMFLDRSTSPAEEKPENKTRPDKGEAWLIIAKNRHGSTRDIVLDYAPDIVRFRERYMGDSPY